MSLAYYVSGNKRKVRRWTVQCRHAARHTDRGKWFILSKVNPVLKKWYLMRTKRRERERGRQKE
jgi:hypothetical protein